MFAGVAWAPLLALISAVLIMASATGAAGAWKVQQVRVEHAELAAANDHTKLTTEAATSAGLKRQLAEANAARATLDKRLTEQAGQIAGFAKAADDRTERIDSGLASARVAIDGMRAQQTSLEARVRAVKPGATCADAWSDIRATLK